MVLVHRRTLYRVYFVVGMKKTVKLLDNKINVDVRKFLDGKLLLQANTGGGKSWAIRRILEQLYDVVPQIILDTEGEFHTLRERFDYILVAKGQQITADYKSAGLLAHKMIESRSSFIIDLFEQTPYEREMFVKNFVEAMTNAPKKLWLPTLLVVDEAQTYAPEGDKTETGRALHDAAFKFRKRHYGILFATPRIAALSKNVISACKNKLIGYTSYEGDVKRAAYELGFTTKDQWRSLRDLEPGQFFAFGPALSKEVITVQIGSVKTAHGDEGEVHIEVVKPSERTRKALAVLATVPQTTAQEAKTIQELQGELRAAKGKISSLERDIKSHSHIDSAEMKRVVEKNLGTAKMLHDKELETFKNTLYQKLLKSHGNVFKALESLSKDIDALKNGRDYELPSDFKRLKNEIKIEPAFKGTKWEMRDRKGTVVKSDGTGMGDGERKVLIAIAGVSEITRELVTLTTGYKTSTRNAYIYRLLQKGYVVLEGDTISATDEGRDALGSDYKMLPTGPELARHYLETLPDGERKVFQVLYDAGIPLSREQISEQTNYKASTRNAYIHRLRTRQLVNLRGEGMIKASNHLYD